MKVIKFLTLLLAFGLLISSAQARDPANKFRANQFKNWRIISSRSGGIAGMTKSFTLDSAGNLKQRDRNKESSGKIDERDIREITKIITQLKLPSSKMKTSEGQRIYDGVHSVFTIELDGQAYKVEGNFFLDTKIVALNSNQRETFARLKRKLETIGAALR